MYIAYPVVIVEDPAALLAQEQHLRGTKAADRGRFLRLLKSGEAPTISAAAALVGYSATQAYRWWTQYQAAGLARVLQVPVRPGRPTQLRQEARADLHAAMQRGEMATLRAAQTYLQEHWGIRYQSINGIWWQLRQERTRKKTGRRRHQLSRTEDQMAFKKTLPRP